MLLPREPSIGKRSFVIFLGGAFALGTGVLALALATGGFSGKGGAANAATALPNLVTGIASISGGLGYLALRKWAVPTYTIALIGHFVAHGFLFILHRGVGRISTAGIVSLWLIPTLSLLVLVSMEQQRRRGTLA